MFSEHTAARRPNSTLCIIRLLSGLLLCLWHTAFAMTRWQSDSAFNVKS